jgi:hypothetical protein
MGTVLKTAFKHYSSVVVNSAPEKPITYAAVLYILNLSYIARMLPSKRSQSYSSIITVALLHSCES